MSSIDALIQELADLHAGERSRNLYAHSPPRRANLTHYLRTISSQGPTDLMLVEAPGYRGCGYTGIPITSERIIMQGLDRLTLFDDAAYTLTSDNPAGMAEASATIFWGAIDEHAPRPPLVWNTFPLHPHKKGRTQSNRAPTRTEQRMGHPFIKTIWSLFEIERVYGVGRIAQRNLTELEISHIPLRHPAQGGKSDFIAGYVDSLRG